MAIYVTGRILYPFKLFIRYCRNVSECSKVFCVALVLQHNLKMNLFSLTTKRTSSIISCQCMQAYKWFQKQLNVNILQIITKNQGLLHVIDGYDTCFVFGASVNKQTTSDLTRCCNSNQKNISIGCVNDNIFGWLAYVVCVQKNPRVCLLMVASKSFNAFT